MKPKTRSAPPRAMAMLESLRGLGYSTGAALADIIDNSVSAGATEVRVDFAWDGKSTRSHRTADTGRGGPHSDGSTCRSHRRAGHGPRSELRTARYQTGGDPGPEDPERQQRE